MLKILFDLKINLMSEDGKFLFSVQNDIFKKVFLKIFQKKFYN